MWVFISLNNQAAGSLEPMWPNKAARKKKKKFRSLSFHSTADIMTDSFSHKQASCWGQDRVLTELPPQRARSRLRSWCHIPFDFLSKELIAWITALLMEGNFASLLREPNSNEENNACCHITAKCSKCPECQETEGEPSRCRSLLKAVS